MKQILKQVAAVCLLLTVCLAANAQQSPLKKALAGIKGEVLNTEVEQGRDHLDSLFYCRVTTIALPYKSKRNIADAEKTVRQILGSFNEELPTASYGVVHEAKAEPQSDTAIVLSVFYADNRPSLRIGENGRNYVVMRKASPHNSLYRNVYGMEWWVEKDRKRVMIRHIDVYGPRYDRSSRFDEMMQQMKKDFSRRSLEGQSLMEGYFEEGKVDTCFDDTPHIKINVPVTGSYYDDLVYQVHVLAGLYKPANSTVNKSINKAIIRNINNCVKSFFSNMKASPEQYVSLFKELDTVPGYGVEIVTTTTSKARTINTKNYITFGKLAKTYSTLSIFCTSWLDDTDLYVRNLGRYPNGILQIVLN